MIVRLYNTNYKMDQALASSAKKVIRNILADVKTESEIRGFSGYYVAFVVMMYVMSASILENLGKENILKIVHEIRPKAAKKEKE